MSFTIYCFLYFLCSSFLFLNISHKIKNHTTIQDIIHKNFPDLQHSSLKYLSDILLSCQLLLLLTNITSSILVEFFIIVGTTQFMRCLTVSTTILPKLTHSDNKVRLWGINGTGKEYIFSGHSVYGCFFYLYLIRLGYDWKVLTLYNILTQFLTVATHNHYTVDIILAWFITLLLYSNTQLLKMCRML